MRRLCSVILLYISFTPVFGFSPDVPAGFGIFHIDKGIEFRIKGKSFPDYEQDKIRLDNLRYLNFLHYGFDGEIHEGEMVCNQDIADDLVDIFYELYKARYPIEKAVLIDDYGAVDEKSMRDNNTSCFCYRLIARSDKLSVHGLGLAVDINPLYNPYVKPLGNGEDFIQPETAAVYKDRDQECPYYIKKYDLVYTLFTAHGFEWGGDWKGLKDYQHFEKN